MAKLVRAQLVISQRNLKRAMMPAIAQELTKLFRSKFSILFAESAQIIEEEIQNHPVYDSIISQNPHELGSLLGIENAVDVMHRILSVWRNSLRLDMTDVIAAGTRLRGGITITAVDNTNEYEEVTNLPEASYIAERALRLGIDPYLIEWLKWLLVKGTDPLVYYYYVDTELKEGDNSRTGLSVMRKDKNLVEIFRIPDQYAGTEQKNFILEAMDKATRRIQELLIREIS